MSQVPKRRNRAQDRARMERFLEMKSVVCKGPGELPSRRLSCCRQFCHEDCLIQWFKYARCPHCTQTLVPCNSNEETPPVAPGRFLFVFQMVHYNSSLLTFGEFESDQLFVEIEGFSRYKYNNFFFISDMCANKTFVTVKE